MSKKNEVINVNEEIIKIENIGVIDYTMAEKTAAVAKKRIKDLDIENMLATNENKQNLKDLRADLNKEFDQLEKERKAIKNIFTKPYNDFDSWYKENITAVYGGAKNLLNEKIDGIENEQKDQRLKLAVDTFNEFNTIDWLTFEYLQFRPNLSDSDKKVKDTVTGFIEKVESDLNVINTQPHTERVLALYRNTLDLNYSIATVHQQVAQEEAIKQEREQMQAPQIEAPTPEPIEEDNTPLDPPTMVEQPQEDNQLYRFNLSVTATKKQIINLRQYMSVEGIQYE